MLYIGYWIILDRRSKKKSVLEISIFELPQLENCIGRLRPRCGGGGGGLPRGVGHNLLMQLCSRDSSKMKIFETEFFGYSDHPK